MFTSCVKLSFLAEWTLLIYEVEPSSLFSDAQLPLLALQKLTERLDYAPLPLLILERFGKVSVPPTVLCGISSCHAFVFIGFASFFLFRVSWEDILFYLSFPLPSVRHHES